MKRSGGAGAAGLSGIIPAQLGYTSGGLINAVSRSGVNQVHGSVYEFFRNDPLDARRTFLARHSASNVRRLYLLHLYKQPSYGASLLSRRRGTGLFVRT